MNYKKKLLIVLITNSIAAPVAVAAQSELQIYGSIAAAVESLDNGVTKIAEVSNNHSALGFKGSVAVDDTLKGVFLFDNFLAIDSGDSSGSGNGSLFGGGRDGFVGLAGGFGTIALGYHGRPWKTSTNNMDIFGSTIADYSAIMGSTSTGEAYFDGGIGNGVIWFLPNMSGFSGQLQVGADEADDDSSDSGLQFNFTQDNLYLSLSYDVDGKADPDDDISAVKLAGQFKAGSTSVGAIFESISDSKPNTRDAFWLGIAHKVNTLTFKLAAATATESDAKNDDGATYYALGLDHQFSKNLSTYVIYSQIKNDTGGAYKFTSAPHTSSNGNTDPNGDTNPDLMGEDSSVIAVGLRLDFNYKAM